MKQLPTIKEHFRERFYEPVTKDPLLSRTSYPVRFDAAKERFEQVFGCQLPFGEKTFEKELQGKR